MNALLDIPLAIRLAALFAAGATLASGLHAAVYSLGWEARRLSPWLRQPKGASTRRWSDYLPIAGWLSMRRLGKECGQRFWIRPLLVEIFFGLAIAGLYWWEIDKLRLLPPLLRETKLPLEVYEVLHLQYLSHVVLAALMLVASLIDFDETNIPDTVTVPGAVVGLVLATALPWSLLPVVWLPQQPAPPHALPLLWNQNVAYLSFLDVTAPQLWPPMLEPAPQWRSLAIALGCWGLWCFALLPRKWLGRRGPLVAIRIFIRTLLRHLITWCLLAIGLVGAMAIAAVWWRGGPLAWQGLLTALVGLAVGGGIVWAVRLIGTAALRREAMGFGDVTLMAMIGTFVGWQPCLIIFFLAPFAGLVLGLAQWMFHGNREIPYGPFLCLATMALVVLWAPIWQWAAGTPPLAPGVFAMGWLVPGAVAVCLVLMAGMLMLIHAVRR